MKEYKDVKYSKYLYYYFDGSYSSGLDIENYFKGYASDVSVYQYNIKTINVNGYDMPLERFKDFYENEDISINIKKYEKKYTVRIDNSVNAYKGDYIVMLDSRFPFFAIEKNLDDYEIISEHECKKKLEKTYLYDKYIGFENTKSIIDEIRNYVDTISINYDDRNESIGNLGSFVSISNKYPYLIIINKCGEKHYLTPGDYVVVDSDDGRLFVAE